MKNILIFDYDGVIADSIEIFMKKVIYACVKNGSNKVNTKDDFLKLFEDNLYASLIKAGIREENIPDLIKDFQISEKEQSNIKLFNGIKEILVKLSKYNKTIIITSNVTSTVEESLKSKGLECFEEVIGADKETSKVKKIEAIKSKFKGCSIFYIGDTKGDMIEGRKAGVKTVAVTWGWHRRNKLNEAEPDYIVDSPDGLLPLFKTPSGTSPIH